MLEMNDVIAPENPQGKIVLRIISFLSFCYPCLELTLLAEYENAESLSFGPNEQAGSCCRAFSKRISASRQPAFPLAKFPLDTCRVSVRDILLGKIHGGDGGVLVRPATTKASSTRFSPIS